MTTPVRATELPAVLQRILGGRDLQLMVGRAALLVTLDPAGWPHASLLTFGELLGTDAHTVRLGLASDGASAANLSRTRRALLHVVYGPAAYSIAGEVEPLPPAARPGQARFAMRVARVVEERAAGHRLTGGMTFAPQRRTREVLAEWETALAALAE